MVPANVGDSVKLLCPVSSGSHLMVDWYKVSAGGAAQGSEKTRMLADWQHEENRVHIAERAAGLRMVWRRVWPGLGCVCCAAVAHLSTTAKVLVWS